MRDPGPFDKTLLALGLAWLVCFGLSLDSAVRETGYPSLILEKATGGSGAPRVAALVPGTGAERSGLQPGDRLLRAGDVDLRGKGHLALYEPFSRAGPGGNTLAVRYERAGEVREAELPVGSYRMYWPRLPASLVFAVAAMLLALRAPGAPMVRAFARTFLVAGIFLACTFGGGPVLTGLAVTAHVASVALVIPLSLRAALLFPDGDPPAGRLARLGPWAFVGLGLFEASRFYELPFPRDVGVVAMVAGDLLFFGLLLAIVTRAWRRADPVGRRQLKWVLLGLYLAVALPIATTALSALGPGTFPALVVSMATLGIVPISVVVAIVRYNLFDIDRLINSTVSYTVIGIVLLAGVLAAVPRAAQALAGPTGVEPATAQLVLSLMLAAVLVPCHHWLGPRVEGVFFPERQALSQGMDALLRELAGCRSPRDLAQLAGERLDALLRPESCAIYARDAEVFSPILVRGRTPAPAFPATSPLVPALEARGVPLAADGPAGPSAALSPFDRAALETLGVPVVVPVRIARTLVLVLCLGAKRSGDVYTSGDLALLAAMADKLAAELQRFDRDEILREAHDMQATLRRYVPGALLDEISEGRDLEEGQREVAVLFVDIRGYSRFAEDRSAAEIFSTVNRYTKCVSEIVRKHGGSVVEFNGDGMMAVFGAPRAVAHKERAAVLAGRELVSAVAALPVEAGAELEVGVGVATGEAYVGNIQAADRMIWSAVGNTTNLAARLQEMTRELDAAMVIDRTTHARAGEAADGFRAYRAALIRGRRQTQDVFALPLG